MVLLLGGGRFLEHAKNLFADSTPSTKTCPPKNAPWALAKTSPRGQKKMQIKACILTYYPLNLNRSGNCYSHSLYI